MYIECDRTEKRVEFGPNEGRRATRPSHVSDEVLKDQLAACTRPEDRSAGGRREEESFFARLAALQLPR